MYELINYFDVWGNKQDGYEVNNLCTEERDIYLGEDASDMDLLKFLKRIGFLKKHVRLNMLCIEDLGGQIEISDIHGMPICRFQEQFTENGG